MSLLIGESENMSDWLNILVICFDLENVLFVLAGKEIQKCNFFNTGNSYIFSAFVVLMTKDCHTIIGITIVYHGILSSILSSFADKWFNFLFLQKVDTCREDDDCREEQSMVDSLLETVGVKVEDPSTRTLAFLESDSSLDCYKSSFNLVTLFKKNHLIVSRLRPSTRNVVVLAAEALALRKDKEYLLNNLLRAEDEMKVIFEENNI
ncbi:unnamed protein product [Cuscuta europaea]|uniref:Uncharacterized protein n=1 Tax=Cuscuta europaea TaxID=41803 RepID=A0A9P1E1J8_CUSEU|nr:unnamed protein product [Cuscuta europaea]